MGSNKYAMICGERRAFLYRLTVAVTHLYIIIIINIQTLNANGDMTLNVAPTQPLKNALSKQGLYVKQIHDNPQWGAQKTPNRVISQNRRRKRDTYQEIYHKLNKRIVAQGSPREHVIKNAMALKNIKYNVDKS